jgi:hypothetical protein
VVEAVRAQDRIRPRGRDADVRDGPICWVGVGFELETGSVAVRRLLCFSFPTGS